ncbi:uncharacterized protein LOC135201886 [Macrobrachium nipponense]|uniref:uncharacterized protein LOC135201886 n=1 Tax=Macrobrachium nipponense TaxID=159736 RepID=UPI0030C7BB56
MDINTGCSTSGTQEVAGDGRSIRDETKPSSADIFLPGSGSDVNRNRCNATKLGSHAGLCVPTLRSHPSSYQETEGERQGEFDTDSSFLDTTPMVPGTVGAHHRYSHAPSYSEGSTQTTTLPPLPSEPSHAKPSCLETVERAARKTGLSKEVAKQLSFNLRKSTRKLYQVRWTIYRGWCRKEGHSISRPSIPKIADFLLFLRKVKRLSHSAIAGYRSMLSNTFKFHLPEISTSRCIHDLIRSFKIERPGLPNRAPPWDLSVVLRFLSSPEFEPIENLTLRQLTKKVLFLTALATAKRVSELQAVSRLVSYKGDDIFLSFLPEFVAKTESEANTLPRSFRVLALRDFVNGDPEEMRLCPVRALRVYLSRVEKLRPRPRTLFISPRNPSRPISKNAISFFLREVISQAHAGSHSVNTNPILPRAHSIRGMATSSSFLRNYSVSSILEAASWKSVSVFTSFYLRDVQFASSEGYSLSPFVAANTKNTII